MKNIKQWFVKNWSTTKIVIKNLAEFVDAAALASVAGYSIAEAIKHPGYWYKSLLVAGVLIALQAFVLLVKHFNKPAAQ